MAAMISPTEAALLADSNKTIKLRSSCDACNEAKVRCSQSKPNCQRCLRLGTTCVYGLSRRSHKTAPRIGASQTSALAYLYPNSQSTTSDGSDEIDPFRDDLQWLTGQSTPNMNIDAWSYTLDSLSNSSDALFSFNDAADGAYMSKFGQLPQGTDDASMLLSPDLLMLDPQLVDLRQAGNLTPTAGSSEGRSGSTSTVASDSGKAVVSVGRDCTCAARSAHAAAQASASSSENQSFDARLSRLKLNIKTLQDTLSCPCVYEDQTTILSTCVALGRVLHEFQDTLANFSSLTSPPTSRSPSDASDSSVQAPPREGRLSIGTVPVEPEEEQELKLHLWLLQLRKLETILGVMEMTIQKMKNMHGNDFTHIVACESIYKWLTETAKSTRDKFQRGHRHA